MNKSLSVVIPTKNRPEDLMNLVNSLINQTLNPNELIIVDQSENKISKNQIESISGQFSNSKLIYILDSKIKGLVVAKKYGAKLASSDLICFLDDDLILDKRFLEEIVRPFQDTLSILGSSGVLTNFLQKSKLYTIMYSLFHKGLFSDPRPVVFRKYEGYKNKLVKSNVLWGGCTVWQANVIKQVPIDDKNPLSMMEDFDYSAKIREKIGANFVINPNARYVHNHSDINRPSKTDQEKRKIFEYIAYYKKRNIRFIDRLCLFWLFVGLSLHVLYETIKTKELSLLSAFFCGMNKGINFKMINNKNNI